MLCKNIMVFTAMAVLCAVLVGWPARNTLASPIERVHAHNPPPLNQLTVSSVKALKQKKWKTGRDLAVQSQDPMASKLFLWMFFREGKGELHFSHLAQFIRNNPDWPDLGKLRLNAEKNMPDTLDAAAVVDWFDDFSPQTVQGMDRYLEALVGTGKTQQAKANLAQWWAKTPLKRDDQRAFFKKYRHLIDHNAHKKRLSAVLHSRQYTNARAIAKMLGNGYPELVEARIALAEKKGGVSALIRKVPKHLQNDPGLMFERLKWRRKKDLNDGAMKILQTAPPADQVENPGEWWRERHIIIRRLLEERSFAKAYEIASRHSQIAGFSYAQAEWLSGWIAMSFLNRPDKAHQHFKNLYKNVSTPISKARGAYWAGLSARKLGYAESSTSWLQEAAKYQTTFYGQLALAEEDGNRRFSGIAPPDLTRADMAAFYSQELITAARLMNQAGLDEHAGDFIQAFLKQNASPKAFRFAAEFASGLGYHHEALRVAKDAGKEGMFLTAQAYPVITDKLSRVNLEWALVHAIIRQESMFDFKAKSRVGARGLMQLMPATAREVAGQLRMRHRTSYLYKPAHNIRLGSYYLATLLERFDGSYPLAIAAYNAGPNRVDKWLDVYGDPRKGKVDFIDWMELIPIYETRNYVQRVMEAVYIYRLRLKNIQPTPDVPLHVAMRLGY